MAAATKKVGRTFEMVSHADFALDSCGRTRNHTTKPNNTNCTSLMTSACRLSACEASGSLSWIDAVAKVVLAQFAGRSAEHLQARARELTAILGRARKGKGRFHVLVGQATTGVERPARNSGGQMSSLGRRCRLFTGQVAQGRSYPACVVVAAATVVSEVSSTTVVGVAPSVEPASTAVVDVPSDAAASAAVVGVEAPSSSGFTVMLLM